MKRWLFLAVLLALPPRAEAQVVTGEREAEAAQIASRLAGLRGALQSRRGSVLGLMGYNATPDASANALSISRGSTAPAGTSDVLTLAQYGFGYTISDDFPLYLENFLGVARYDPRAFFKGAEIEQAPLVHWNNFALTLGVGWDFKLSEYWTLRPILDGVIGYAASDATLLNSFINYRRNTDISALANRHMNVHGYGGSLMLVYADYRPAREIDVQVRGTQLWLQTFGDTVPAGRGSLSSTALGVAGRLRWPTGAEVFGRPLRWLVEGAATSYLGGQRQALGFAWSSKFGAGIEFDVGRYELWPAALSVSRVSFVGSYFLGDNGVTGVALGIGISF